MASIITENQTNFQDVPVQLTVEQQSLYIDLVDEYIKQMMPSISGRLFAQITSLIGGLMASKASLLLAGVPLLGKGSAARALVTSGKEVLGAVQISAPAGAGAFARIARSLESKLATSAAQKFTKASAGNIAFWSVLGFAEDTFKDYDYLMAVWRRQIRPDASFLKNAPQYAKDLSEFVSKLESEVWEVEQSEFDKYIRSADDRGELVPYTLSVEGLIYAFLWLDAAQRYLRAENTPKGTPNPHIYALQVWIASLIIQLKKNGVDKELVFSDAYPVYTWTGLPKGVALALDAMYARGAEVRDAYEELGFTDSETFQSVGTTFLQVCTKAGLQAMQNMMPGGVLSWLASQGIIGTVKKASPYVLRFGDIMN